MERTQMNIVSVRVEQVSFFFYYRCTVEEYSTTFDVGYFFGIVPTFSISSTVTPFTLAGSVKRLEVVKDGE